MERLIEELASLTRTALQGEAQPTIASDPIAFFKLARENGLSGMVYPALKESDLPIQIRERFKGDWLRYQARDVAQRAAVEELDRACDEVGLDHLYLKGVVVKECYPEPYMRAMGDIDVLFRREDMEKARALFVEKIGFQHHMDMEAHDIFMRDRDLIVEAHRSIDVESDEERWHVFSDPWAHAKRERGSRFAFEPEYFLLHLLRHLAKHLLSSGIGLRSILDIGLYVGKMQAHIDQESLKTLLEHSRLDRFCANVMSLNRILFGIDPVPSLDEEAVSDPAFIDEIVAYIATSGVHGTAAGFNQQAVGMTRETMKRGSTGKGRVSYLIRVAFPPRKALRDQYAYLRTRGWLLPIAWIQRWWTKLFR